MQLVRRSKYLDRIAPFVDTDVIKVITGLRRSGKSVLMQQIQEDLLDRGVGQDQIIAMNFEVMGNGPAPTARELRQEILQKLPDDPAKRTYIFLDEVQEVEQWEKVVNSLRVECNADLFVTGSNAHLLSGELATLLSGRYVQFPVYPFSFQEFLEMQAVMHTEMDNAQAFREFMTLGGMPYLSQVAYSEELSVQYLHDLFDAVQLKDIVRRAGVRDADLLDRLLTYVFANIGSPFSARSVVRFLKNEGRKTSVDTILSYLKTGVDAYLLRRVRREDLQGKHLLSSAEKYYVADHGLRQAILGTNMMDIQRVLENIVCLELLRRGFDVRIGDNDGKEIDFVATKGAKRLYVQATYLLATPETVEREFGAYAGLPDNFPKHVVSMDEIDLSRNGIQHWNVRDFLLSEAWS